MRLVLLCAMTLALSACKRDSAADLVDDNLRKLEAANLDLVLPAL